MKKAWIEFRIYLAEKVLSWAFSIAPLEGDGNHIKITIGKYFYEACLRNYTEAKKHL